MLIKPIITEKSMREAGLGRFTFMVDKMATKPEIAKETEKRFKVNVTAVRTLNMPGKTYRSGKRWIYKERPEWKKAVVIVKAGQKIELFDTKQTNPPEAGGQK